MFGMDAIGVGVNIVDSIVQNADSVLEGSLEILPRSARDAGPELQASRKSSVDTHPYTRTHKQCVLDPKSFDYLIFCAIHRALETPCSTSPSASRLLLLVSWLLW